MKYKVLYTVGIFLASIVYLIAGSGYGYECREYKEENPDCVPIIDSGRACTLYTYPSFDCFFGAISDCVLLPKGNTPPFGNILTQPGTCTWSGSCSVPAGTPTTIFGPTELNCF